MNALVINGSPVRSGATAEIVSIISNRIKEDYKVKSVCIDDFKINFCKGCRSCHQTAKCIQNDDVNKVIELYDWADVIITVVPSYWADIPGQFKTFIDRCTPWCNTHEPYARIRNGKKGYTVALRTGPSMREYNRVIESIEHFYGHLDIECSNSMCLCSIENKGDVRHRNKEILDFCSRI